MKKNKGLSSIAVVFITLSVTSCSVPSNYNYQPTIAYYDPPKSKFLGWDEYGHKKFDTDKEQNQLMKVYEWHGGKIKSTILNEDAIICETDSPLLVSPDISKYPNVGKYFTGSDLISIADSKIRLLELDEQYRDTEQGYLNKLQSISTPSFGFAVTNLRRDSYQKQRVMNNTLSSLSRERKFAHLSN